MTIKKSNYNKYKCKCKAKINQIDLVKWLRVPRVIKKQYTVNNISYERVKHMHKMKG